MRRTRGAGVVTPGSSVPRLEGRPRGGASNRGAAPYAAHRHRPRPRSANPPTIVKRPASVSRRWRRETLTDARRETFGSRRSRGRRGSPPAASGSARSSTPCSRSCRWTLPATVAGHRRAAGARPGRRARRTDAAARVVSARCATPPSRRCARRQRPRRLRREVPVALADAGRRHRRGRHRRRVRERRRLGGRRFQDRRPTARRGAGRLPRQVAPLRPAIARATGRPASGILLRLQPVKALQGRPTGRPGIRRGPCTLCGALFA